MFTPSVYRGHTHVLASGIYVAANAILRSFHMISCMLFLLFLYTHILSTTLSGAKLSDVYSAALYFS